MGAVTIATTRFTYNTVDAWYAGRVNCCVVIV